MFKHFVMQTTIKKWGNSLAVRISATLARESGISEGTIVDITPENKNLVIRPLRKRYVLSELLDKVCDENRHEEIETGGIKGKEVW